MAYYNVQNKIMFKQLNMAENQIRRFEAQNKAVKESLLQSRSKKLSLKISEHND